MAQHPEAPADQAKRLGARARERRRALGLTQQDLADLAGVGVRSVHDFERGKVTMRFEIISAIMTSLGLMLETVLAQAGRTVGTGDDSETP